MICFSQCSSYCLQSCPSDVVFDSLRSLSWLVAGSSRVILAIAGYTVASALDLVSGECSAVGVKNDEEQRQ